MAERLTTNQEVPGSTPGWIDSFCQFLLFDLLCGDPGPRRFNFVFIPLF